MGVRFFIDENIGYNLAKALGLVEVNVEHLLDTFEPGTKDVKWLEYVGKNKLALITKDRNIGRNPKEKALLIEYKVVAFFLGGSKQSTEDILMQILKARRKMEDIAEKQFKKDVAGAFVVRQGGGKIVSIQLT